MQNTKNYTEEMKGFFNTLPEHVKTSIVESDVEVKSLKDLENLAANLTNKEQ